MTDLRDHSQPCGNCGRYSPEVDHGYLEPQRTCGHCGGAGGRVAKGEEVAAWLVAQVGVSKATEWIIYAGVEQFSDTG